MGIAFAKIIKYYQWKPIKRTCKLCDDSHSL